MGPPPEGQECAKPPCAVNTNWFRKRRRRQAAPPMPPRPTQRPENLDTFGLVSFFMPPGLRFGSFPVPESCCAEAFEYCGLENEFSFQTKRIIFPNLTDFNQTDPFVVNATQTPTIEPIEPIIDNIYTRGCYPDFKTAEILKSTELDVYVLFFSVFHISLYFTFLLFTLLLYFDCSLANQRYTQRYGQPVKISRTL